MNETIDVDLRIRTDLRCHSDEEFFTRRSLINRPFS